MFNRRKSIITVIILSFILVFAGCSNNGTNDSSGETDNNGTLTGTVQVPAGTTTASLINNHENLFASIFNQTALALSGEIPLPEASIIVYDYQTGEQITTGMADSSGNYSITGIPAGIDVVIVATKGVNSGNDTVRVSAVVADITTEETKDITTATTLVAEVAGQLMGQDKDVTVEELASAEENANTIVAGMTEADVTVGGDLLGFDFGTGIKDEEREATLETDFSISVGTASGSLVDKVTDQDENTVNIDIPGLLVFENNAGKEFKKYYDIVPFSQDSQSFTFELPAGEYSLNVYKLGYSSYSDSITITADENLDLGNLIVNKVEENVEASGVEYYLFNTSNPPFDNKDVRKAFIYALNKDEILTDLHNSGITGVAEDYPATTGSILIDNMYGYDSISITNPYSYDLEQAKELIAGVNISETDSDIEFLFDTKPSGVNNEIISIIEPHWDTDLSTDLNISKNGVDWETYMTSIGESNYDIARMGFLGYGGDPVEFLDMLEYMPYVPFTGEEVKLLQKVKYNIDDEDVALFYIEELQNSLLENATIIPIFKRK